MAPTAPEPLENRPAQRKQEAIVICGFAAIGKSTFKATCETRGGYDGRPVIDLDSSLFARGPEWPQNYIHDIKQRLGQRCILMVSTHRDVYTRLIEDGVDLVLVYPKRELRAEWLGRIRQREASAASGAGESICGLVGLRWDDWISDCDRQTGCARYAMEEGEYLRLAIGNVLQSFQDMFLS